LKIPNIKRAGGVVQGVGPEFKHPSCKKKKKKKKRKKEKNKQEIFLGGFKYLFTYSSFPGHTVRH
jgi:hypothetical protein